jgi:ribosomal protein S18 acetylase RimI-like enzyme
VGDARDVPADEVRDALDTLLKLIRKEWAARDATNPAVDSQAGQFLHDVVPELVERGLLRIGQIAAGGQVVASDLVARDGDRHVRLLAGVDPEQQKSSVPLELLLASLRAAVQAGGRRFELGSDDDEPGEHIRTTPSKVLRARLWSGSTTAKLHRGVQAVQALRGGPAARGGTLGTIERLQKAAPEVLQRALGRVAQVTTLHLYRGELFWRDVREAGDLSLKLFSLAEFEALAERARDELAARLDLAIGYCRQKWSRGDTVVLAEVAGRPAGILWCARSAVYVPDIGREVRPGPGECYIHDVYVHPDERGRQVAPAMLDFLARELRARDVYRAWALIERSNSPSVRAFEKAAYASVSDVVYARIGLLSRLIVRPPDPEARAFLGLT